MMEVVCYVSTKAERYSFVLLNLLSLVLSRMHIKPNCQSDSHYISLNICKKCASTRMKMCKSNKMAYVGCNNQINNLPSSMMIHHGHAQSEMKRVPVNGKDKDANILEKNYQKWSISKYKREKASHKMKPAHETWCSVLINDMNTTGKNIYNCI